MLFDVIAVQSAEALLWPLFQQFTRWLGTKFPRAVKLLRLDSYGKTAFMVLRTMMESYFILKHRTLLLRARA